MHELRAFFCDQLRVALCLVALGGLVPVQVVQAQEVADPAFNRFRSQVVGNNVNFSYGAGGTPLGGAGNATGIGVGSGVDVGRSVAVNTKHGPVNGTLTQKVSNAAMGRAFGRAAAVIGGPVGLAFLALPAIVDWMSDAGVSHESGQFTKPDPEACTSAPCYEYGHSSLGSQRYGSMGAVCSAIGGLNGLPVYSANPYTCVFGEQGLNGSVQVNAYSVPPGVGSPVPATAEEIGDRMGAVNPSPEALAELYKLAGYPNFDVAHPIPDLVDTLRADFEARSPETTETSSSSTPTEDKTETRKCATYTQVSGSTVGLVEQCETTTSTQPKDPETGQPIGDPTVTTGTTSSTAPDPATKPEEQAQDPCINAPNRVACMEAGTAEGEIPKATRSVDFEPEELFGGGSCPTDQTFTFRSSTIPITNYAQACDMLQTYVRPMTILLAFFAAMMILVRGMPE